MKKTVLTALIALMAPTLAAFAQEQPKYEFFGGFSFVRQGGGNGIGWNVAGSKTLNHYLGIAVDASVASPSPSESYNGYRYDFDNRQYIFLAGPQVTSRDPSSRVSPFLHLLFGGAHYSTDYRITQSGVLAGSGSYDGNAFAMTLGGGIDYRIKGAFGVRLFQINYMGVRSSGVWTKGWRFSFGPVFQLGKQAD